MAKPRFTAEHMRGVIMTTQNRMASITAKAMNEAMADARFGLHCHDGVWSVGLYLPGDTEPMMDAPLVDILANPEGNTNRRADLVEILEAQAARHG